MFDLSGKVAVVTGGSRGIGREVSTTLAARGAKVAIGYASQEAKAHEVANAISSRGGSAEVFHCDVADIKGTEASLADIGKRHGRLDILVASAGISIDALVLRLKEEDFDRTLSVNLKGAVFAARAALKSMMRARSGRVIFISSVVGETGNAGQIAYAASKAGLLGAARSLAREFASRGVTVNAVAPGYIETDMTSALTEEQRQGMLSTVPLGRAGTTADVAAAVAFLASDEAGYVTGHTLRVNGGMHM
jgi:3-oxoacyl-[acyl-carrier protein] reductase